MEEKILIKSESYKIKNFTNSLIIIGAIFAIGYVIATIQTSDFPILEGIVIFGFFALVAIIINVFFKGHSLTITDKRVYGITRFGKRVDLPNDKISSVSIRAFKGIEIASSSGKVSFLFIKNRNEIFDKISDLLSIRQNQTNETIIKQEIPQSNADELKKYKDLLDSGVITQEEFDAKKKQLLGL